MNITSARGSLLGAPSGAGSDVGRTFAAFTERFKSIGKSKRRTHVENAGRGPSQKAGFVAQPAVLTVRKRPCAEQKLALGADTRA